MSINKISFESKSKLVFFDLDGTITRHDTFMPYLLFCAMRRGIHLLKAPLVLPELIRYISGQSDRGKLKGYLIKTLLGGTSRKQIQQWTASFIPKLLNHGIFEAARFAINQHQAEGDYLVLMSASVDLYVPSIGAALGFNETICSIVQWEGEVLSGQLYGENVRGTEKLNCLMEISSRFPGFQITAYGNSEADLAHLQLSNHPILINAGPALQTAANNLNVTYKYWN